MSARVRRTNTFVSMNSFSSKRSPGIYSNNSSGYESKRSSLYNYTLDTYSYTRSSALSSNASSTYSSNTSSVYNTNRNSWSAQNYKISSYQSSFGSSYNAAREINPLPENTATSSNIPRIEKSDSFDEQESVNSQFNKFASSCRELRKDLNSYEKNWYERSKNAIDKNDSEGKNGNITPDDSQSEWQKYFEARSLLERACEVIRTRPWRQDKASFGYDYSPDTPSPYPYDYPSNTVLVHVPYSPGPVLGRPRRTITRKKSNNVLNKDPPKPDDDKVSENVVCSEKSVTQVKIRVGAKSNDTKEENILEKDEKELSESSAPIGIPKKESFRSIKKQHDDFNEGASGSPIQIIEGDDFLSRLSEKDCFKPIKKNEGKNDKSEKRLSNSILDEDVDYSKSPKEDFLSRLRKRESFKSIEKKKENVEKRLSSTVIYSDEEENETVTGVTKKDSFKANIKVETEKTVGEKERLSTSRTHLDVEEHSISPKPLSKKGSFKSDGQTKENIEKRLSSSTVFSDDDEDCTAQKTDRLPKLSERGNFREKEINKKKNEQREELSISINQDEKEDSRLSKPDFLTRLVKRNSFMPIDKEEKIEQRLSSSMNYSDEEEKNSTPKTDFLSKLAKKECFNPIDKTKISEKKADIDEDSPVKMRISSRSKSEKETGQKNDSLDGTNSKAKSSSRIRISVSSKANNDNKKQNSTDKTVESRSSSTLKGNDYDVFKTFYSDDKPKVKRSSTVRYWHKDKDDILAKLDKDTKDTDNVFAAGKVARINPFIRYQHNFDSDDDLDGDKGSQKSSIMSSSVGTYSDISAAKRLQSSSTFRLNLNGKDSPTNEISSRSRFLSGRSLSSQSVRISSRHSANY